MENRCSLQLPILSVLKKNSLVDSAYETADSGSTLAYRTSLRDV